MNVGVSAGILVIQGFQTHDNSLEYDIEIIHPQCGFRINETDPDGHGVGALRQDIVIKTTVRHAAEEQVGQNTGEHYPLAFIFGQPLNHGKQATECRGEITVQFQEPGRVIYGAVIEIIPFGERGQLGRSKIMRSFVQKPGVVRLNGILMHKLPVPRTRPPVNRRHASHLCKVMVFNFLAEPFQTGGKGFCVAVHVDEYEAVPHFRT